MSIDAEIDWDDAFSNGAYIPGAEEIAARWPVEARAFRAGATGETDIAYGPGPRDTLDLFMPPAPPRGLFVFIHGGYWHLFGKDDWSHLAAGALARGWAVALPGYTLCPEARIGEITLAMGRAIDVAAAHVAGPVVVSGHSAGGHLAARMACADSPLSPPTRARLHRVAPISGVFDLRPLLHTQMNAILKLDDAEATAESPALQTPLAIVDAVAWVGADERPEFLRQTTLFAEAWPHAVMHVAAARHHFNVIDLLRDRDSAMLEAMLAD